jgi:hypothetical protein
LYQEYFRSRYLHNFVVNRLPLWFMLPNERPSPKEVEEWKELVLDGASLLAFDQSEFRAAFDRRLKQLIVFDFSKYVGGTTPRKSSRKKARSRIPKDPVALLIAKHLEETKRQIGAAPESLHKSEIGLRELLSLDAYDLFGNPALDAFVVTRDQASGDVAKEIIAAWGAERKDRKERDPVGFDLNPVFWSAEDYVREGISRYRFREKFKVGGFDKAFEAFEAELRDTIVAPASSTELVAKLYDLVEISRSRVLSSKLRLSIEVALNQLVEAAESDHWTEWDVRGPYEKRPSVRMSALAACALLKLGIHDTHRRVGTAAAKWLMEQQEPEGFWTATYFNSNREPKADLEVTLSALSAISRSNLSGNSHCIDLGVRWIERQQSSFGFWDQPGASFISLTVSVLETLSELRARPHVIKDPYLLTAEGFLRRAETLVLDDSPTSRRLAIIAGHQGIEAFVYAVLDRREINIWKDRHETVGLRSGLRMFEDHLKSTKALKPNEVLAFRNSLDSLSHLRDEVVHKAADSTYAIISPLLDSAMQFASKFSREVFGYDLLG